MASKTQIANRTLLLLGQPRVSNIDTDGSPNALVLNSIYDQVRDELLRSYPWNFSIKRASLAESETLEWTDDERAFGLPNDFIRLIEIKNVRDYSIEGSSIICSETDVIYIKYVSRVTDAGLFPSLFSELFSYDMALIACDRITDDVGLKQTLMMQRQRVYERAAGADAMENPTQDFVEDDWISARS